MEERNFVFIKNYEAPEGVVHEGRELRLFRGLMFLDGGMLSPAYQKEFLKLINDDKLRNEYLKETRIIHNKV